MAKPIKTEDLAVLKSHAQVRDPTPETPYHTVEVRRDSCRVSIRATKPFPDPLLAPPRAREPLDPERWVQVRHGGPREDRDRAGLCGCRPLAETPELLFGAWRRVAEAVRYRPGLPPVWAAFADPETGLDTAEALGAAALVACAGAGIELPEGFEGLEAEMGIEREKEREGSDGESESEQEEEEEEEEEYEEGDEEEEDDDEEEDETSNPEVLEMVQQWLSLTGQPSLL